MLRGGDTALGTFWGPPTEMYEELIFRYSASGVVDLTPADAHLACACICLDIPYVAVLAGQKPEEDKGMLRRHLQLLLLESFSREGTRLFRKDLSDVLEPDEARWTALATVKFLCKRLAPGTVCPGRRTRTSRSPPTRERPLPRRLSPRPRARSPRLLLKSMMERVRRVPMTRVMRVISCED